MDMTDVLKLMINSGAAEQVSQQTGISVTDAAEVMEDLLPVLLMGMKGQAANKSTQDGFLQALADHGKQDSKNTAKFLKKVDTDDGAKIVNHLLDAKEQEAVAAKAKKKSGIDTKTILKIMAIMAPLLMSKMGSTAKSSAKKSGSDDMLSVVGGLLDGVDAGDVIKLASLLLK